MKVPNCCVVRVPGILFLRQFSPYTCDWKNRTLQYLWEVALFLPGSPRVSPALVNIRGVRIWGRPGPGTTVPCLSPGQASSPLIGWCGLILASDWSACHSPVSARSELTAQIQTTDWVEFLCRCICKVLQWRLGLELQWSKWQTAVIVVSRAERPAESADQSGTSAVFICLTDRQHGPSPSSDKPQC